MMDKNCHMLNTMNVLDTVAFYLKSYHSYIHESERIRLLLCVVLNPFNLIKFLKKNKRERTIINLKNSFVSIF